MNPQPKDGDERSPLLTRNRSSDGGRSANDGSIRSNTTRPSSGNLRGGSSSARRPSVGSRSDISRSPRLSRNGLSNSITSIGSAYWDWPTTTGSKPNRQSFVLAPEELNLPPQTVLMGSSKLAATLASLRRSFSSMSNLLIEDGVENSLAEGESQGDGNFLLLESMSDNMEIAMTLKEIENELRSNKTIEGPSPETTEENTDESDDEDCERQPRVKMASLSAPKRPRPSLRDTMVQPSFRRAQKSFYKDLKDFSEGSIPQSIVIATCIGCVCGVVAFLYYTVLDALLDLIWKELPKRFVIDQWPEHLYVLWMPLVIITLSVCCGLSIYFLGEPGDLAYTIKCLQ